MALVGSEGAVSDNLLRQMDRTIHPAVVSKMHKLPGHVFLLQNIKKQAKKKKIDRIACC